MVVTTGFFDGVHTGHRLVIGQLVETARSRGDQSLVVTFWPHPRNVLQKDASSLRLLNSLDEKVALLKGLGVDRVEVIQFTKEFSRLTAEQYLRDYVAGRFGGKVIVLGYDNRIGCDCLDYNDTAQLGLRLGLETVTVERLASGTGTAVSSSWIRTMLEAGNVTAASNMLGYDYSLSGVVVSGNKIGKTIGFPTANMELYEPLKLMPASGAYLVKVETLGKQFYGMCNIGRRPTVSDRNSETIETNIFDFSEDIYGLDIKVTFLRRLRSEVKFSTLDTLKRQLEKDEVSCREMITELFKG